MSSVEDKMRERRAKLLTETPPIPAVVIDKIAAREVADDVTATETSVATTPGLRVETTTVSPGASTSEGKRAWWQTLAGYLLTAVSGTVAMYAAEKNNQLLAIVSTVLASIGAAMSGHANSTYSRARTAVKTGVTEK